MPEFAEWWKSFFGSLIPTAAEVPSGQLAARLALAACLGLVVAAVYYSTQRKSRTEAAPFVATLVLLCVLIAMVTQVIGDSLARAFSLAGALAIIRFRTVVEDTRDTAFVIAAVVVGMAIGAKAVGVALAGIPIVALAAALLHWWSRPTVGNGTQGQPGSLVIRVGIGVNPDAALNEALARHVDVHRLQAASTARQGAALDLTYAARLKPAASLLAMIADLNKVDGVQGVEWKNA
ncbi:MAG TPA: DUF4956 domain-containing protein [Gemmataceae bacterium]